MKQNITTSELLKKGRVRMNCGQDVAEGERFELSEDFRPRWFSRPVHSTALPPLRDRGRILHQVQFQAKFIINVQIPSVTDLSAKMRTTKIDFTPPGVIIDVLTGYQTSW